MTKTKLIVLSSVPRPPSSLLSDTTGSCIDNDTTHQEQAKYVLDELDDYNHPRQRRDLILDALQQEQVRFRNDEEFNVEILFDVPSLATATTMTSGKNMATMFHDVYSKVHSTPLLNFFVSAWKKWLDLGSEGRDPIGCSAVPTTTTITNVTTDTGTSSEDQNIPSLIPACTPLLRCHNNNSATKQRESKHVIGQISYYCTDSCTPIFHDLIQEMFNDTVLVQTCLNRIMDNASLYIDDDDNTSTAKVTPIVYYIIPNHPGHHAAYDCFGGYCYVNHIAALAQHITGNNNITSLPLSNNERVVILDVDYHCGNGTAAILQHETTRSDNIMLISIHCDPDYDYPFHMGFRDDSTTNVIHLPLSPGTGWETGYRSTLLQAIENINAFVPTTLLVSLGLDTYDNDPCTIRRAGFTLQLSDYTEMGTLLATAIVSPKPLRQTIFVQEGGYRMDVIGDAAKNVVVSYSQHISH